MYTYLSFLAVRNRSAFPADVMDHARVHGDSRLDHLLLQAEGCQRGAPSNGEREVDASTANKLFLADVCTDTRKRYQ